MLTLDLPLSVSHIIGGCKENIPRVSCKSSFRLNLAHDFFFKADIAAVAGSLLFTNICPTFPPRLQGTA